MAKHVIRVGNVEIMALSDGMLEFDLCNFFPTIPEDQWQPYESHLTEEHKIRFNLGSYLIRSDGRTILVDTGLGPKPADAPDVPWGQLLHDFKANGVRPEEVDMVVMTHLHRDHVGWNLLAHGKKYPPARGPAGPLCQRPHVRLAAGRARPGRADAERAQPDA
ncbi:MAG: hypothetical protein AUG00_08650 [Candidatus Rokubacteria bacterium 13_1_20CM_2_70_7]|nr:MAG: hypothetical protein AUG00_08650 [Candidatus Rokubacteria bacterium 13_1_20CM_2_70_7]